MHKTDIPETENVLESTILRQHKELISKIKTLKQICAIAPIERNNVVYLTLKKESAEVT
jgi:hypothetical protein